ncbi:MAG: hypothetical protein ACUVXI_02965 [bacterium]
METKPNFVHPTIPGALGSRNSPWRDGRDEVAEARLIILDAIDKIFPQYFERERAPREKVKRKRTPRKKGEK